MKHLNQEKTQTLEVQLKVPILRAMVILSMGAILVLFINSLISGFSTVTGITFPLLFITYMVTLILLQRGNYNLASLIFVYSLTLIIGATQLIPSEDGTTNFGQAALLVSFIILTSMLFSPGRKHLIIHIVIMYATFAVSSISSFLAAQAEQLSIGELITPAVVLTLITFIALSVRGIFFRVLQEALERMTEANNHAERFQKLANSASEKLSLAEDMQVQAGETSRSAGGIDSSISGISSNVRGLDEQFQVSRSSLANISSTMEELDEIAASQSANITQTSAAMEEMVASIKNVSGIISAKMKSVDQLRNTAENGADTIRKTSSSFDSLSQHIDSVKNMITLISNIANQTNLLAMNAAIEAAHAGDAGRGFAVVADEVRKLAESSSENAKQVGETLRELVAAVEITGRNVTESGESFNSISKEVGQVSEAMAEVEASAGELSAGSDEILRSTSEMNDLTTRVSHSVKNVKNNGETALSNLEKLGEFVSSLQASINQISSDNAHVNENALELSEKCAEINAFVKHFSESLTSGDTTSM